MYDVRTLREATDEQLHAGILTGNTQFIRVAFPAALTPVASLDGDFTASDLRVLARKLDGGTRACEAGKQ